MMTSVVSCSIAGQMPGTRGWAADNESGALTTVRAGLDMRPKMHYGVRASLNDSTPTPSHEDAVLALHKNVHKFSV